MKTKKKLSPKQKLILLKIGSFIISVAPVLIFIICNWGDYVKTGADLVKLSIGFVIAIILFLLKVIGKLKMPRRVVTYSVICVLCYFLYPLVLDIVYLSALCLLGELLDMCIFQRPIKKLEESIAIAKNADATTAKVSEEVKRILDERENSGGRS